MGKKNKTKDKDYGTLKVRLYDSEDKRGKLTLTAPDGEKKSVSLDLQLEAKFAVLAAKALTKKGDGTPDTMDILEAIATLAGSGVAHIMPVSKEEFDNMHKGTFVAGPGGVIKA